MYYLLAKKEVDWMSLLVGPMQQHLNGHKELTDHADVVEISPDKQVLIPLVCYGSMELEVLVKENDKVKVGTKIAVRNDKMIIPIFSSVSGTVVKVVKNMHDMLRPVDHLVIDNDFQYELDDAIKPLDPEKASVEELIDFMMNAGIVGCGGAGFPAYIKYKFAKDVDTILINAVECEPYITADYRNLIENLDKMIIGSLAMKKMAQAKEVVIAIKESKKDLIALVNKAITEHKGMRVALVPDVYPMGWERTVIYQVFKKRYERLPGEVGIVVNNSTTAISFADALLEGRPIVEKLVTVSGDAIKSPANVRVRVGTPVSQVIEALGGYTVDEVTVIAGGPMMGKTMPNDTYVITPSTNAITVLKPVKYPSIACLRCGRCSDTCPAAIQPVRINEYEKARDVETLVKLSAMDCIECGMCTYVCPSRLEVTEGVRRAKRLIMAKKK